MRELDFDLPRESGAQVGTNQLTALIEKTHVPALITQPAFDRTGLEIKLPSPVHFLRRVRIRKDFHPDLRRDGTTDSIRHRLPPLPRSPCHVGHLHIFRCLNRAFA